MKRKQIAHKELTTKIFKAESDQPGIPKEIKYSLSVRIKDIKSLFPIFQDLDETTKSFIELEKLISKFQALKNSDIGRKRYHLMYNVIQIGNYVEYLIGKTDSSKKILAKCQNQQLKTYKFSEEEQIALFQFTRNVAADFFHLMYKTDAISFLNEFSNMCQGKTNPAHFIKILDDCGYYKVRFHKTKSFFSSDVTRNDRIIKLMHQTVYFLLKSFCFIGIKKYQNARMALIGAGNCSRHYLLSNLGPIDTENSIFQEIAVLRNFLAHPDATNSKKENILEDLDIMVMINSVKKEIKNKENKFQPFKIDILKYIETEKENYEQLESPRAMERSIFNLEQ